MLCQKRAKNDLNDFLNDAWSFSRSFLQFSLAELKKPKSTFINLSSEYSLPCFPLRLRAYEFFSRRTQEDAREGPE